MHTRFRFHQIKSTKAAFFSAHRFISGLSNIIYSQFSIRLVLLAAVGAWCCGVSALFRNLPKEIDYRMVSGLAEETGEFIEQSPCQEGDLSLNVKFFVGWFVGYYSWLVVSLVG